MDEILNMAIEVEGLIRIVKDGDPSAETYTLLKKKTEELFHWSRGICKEKVMDREQGKESIPESAIELEKENDLMMEAAEDSETETPDDDIILSLDEDPETERSSATSPLKEDKAFEASQEEKRPVVNLKAAFSLNDRFLYSRELFDGDMKMFDSTIKSLEGVSNFAVVEDYFYNELDWDSDNPMVQAFMERLQSRFNS